MPRKSDSNRKAKDEEIFNDLMTSITEQRHKFMVRYHNPKLILLMSYRQWDNIRIMEFRHHAYDLRDETFMGMEVYLSEEMDMPVVLVKKGQHLHPPYVFRGKYRDEVLQYFPIKGT